MKSMLTSLSLLILIISCSGPKENTAGMADVTQIQDMPKAVLVIHGGAGTIKKENMTEEREKAYRDKLTEALQITMGFYTQCGTLKKPNRQTILRFLQTGRYLLTT